MKWTVRTLSLIWRGSTLGDKLALVYMPTVAFFILTLPYPNRPHGFTEGQHWVFKGFGMVAFPALYGTYLLAVYRQGRKKLEDEANKQDVENNSEC